MSKNVKGHVFVKSEKKRKIRILEHWAKTTTPIILGTDKTTNFKFCTHIHSMNRKKSPLKISEK